MIPLTEIKVILNEDLGTKLVQALEPELYQIQSVYQRNRFPQKSFAILRQALAESVFNACYNILGDRMRYTDELGHGRQLYLKTFDELGDHLLYPVMIRLPHTQASFSMLNAYAMQEGSLSAQEAILHGFRDMLSPEELSIRERTVSDRLQHRLGEIT